MCALWPEGAPLRYPVFSVDNKAIAGILYETADLLEIDGGDSFRIRSYRNAAEALEAAPEQIADIIQEPKKVLAIPGIGKGMLENFKQLLSQGKLALHAELLKKYRPSMLELLRVQGLGPKTIALIWSAGPNRIPAITFNMCTRLKAGRSTSPPIRRRI